MRTRNQKGYVFKRGNYWFLRYYDSLVVGSKDEKVIERKQLTHQLALASEFKGKNAAELRRRATDFLDSINRKDLKPEGTMTLKQFVEQYYWPYVTERKRPSTLKGYKDMFRNHVDARCGSTRLRDFTVADTSNVLAEIARSSPLNRTSLKHIKALMSGMFNRALVLGFIKGVNPVHGAELPNVRQENPTHAYLDEDVRRMLMVLPEPARTVVGTAAYTGLRKGELMGLLWENYSGSELSVTQSLWRNTVQEPKTEKSKAKIPVIPALKAMLDHHRLRSGNPQSGAIFKGQTGNPMDLDSLARRVIQPALTKADIEWHGWHAFRRGLATNLYRMGVSDKTIQAVLRHANVATTMNCYVKSVPADVVDAMKVFQTQINTNHATRAEVAVTVN